MAFAFFFSDAFVAYAQMKFYFMKTKVSPYLSLSGGGLIPGGCFNDEGAIIPDSINVVGYSDISLGADVKLKNGKSVAIGLYFPITTERRGVGYSNMQGDGGYKLTYSF